MFCLFPLDRVGQLQRILLRRAAIALAERFNDDDATRDTSMALVNQEPDAVGDVSELGVEPAFRQW